MISVTDTWFRSTQSSISLAAAVGLSSTVHDSEDFWEWVIGDLDDLRLDITRAHARAPNDTDVRIFRLDNGEFDAALRDLPDRRCDDDEQGTRTSCTLAHQRCETFGYTCEAWARVYLKVLGGAVTDKSWPGHSFRRKVEVA
jgi:hypothetical protein